jgi:hypothetical protein
VNLPRWRSDTLVRYVEHRGQILNAWEDDEPEQAIFIHTLGWGSQMWHNEAEPKSDPGAGLADIDDAILDYLREHGEGRAQSMAREHWRWGSLGHVRARLEAMTRSGRVVRTSKRTYRAT